MINITNDISRFFEEKEGEVIIYGAGNAGYWVGYYMNLCKMNFSFYVDKNTERSGSLYNNKPVYSTNKLGMYREKPIRIIVTPRDYESVMNDLYLLEVVYGFNALCLLPKYVHVTDEDRIERYHINRFLAYFRRKLFVGEVPTIITNNCSAGFIYQLMDMVMLSPTINTLIMQDDFIKLCKNPKYYFGIEMKELHWERPFGNPQHMKDMPSGQIGDINILFGHTSSTEGLVERWNMMREKINWNRLIFVCCDHDMYTTLTIKNEVEFMKLKEEHLLLTMRNSGLWGTNGYNRVFLQQQFLEKSDSAIENYFDLLGWLNKDYEM